MNPKKLRRKLIGLCFWLFAAWVITTFSTIVLWYAKGGGRGLAPDVSGVLRTFIFYVIPGLSSGYLLFGLCLLRFILESKKSDDETSLDA
jgi:hypothetical protein